ncbi:MAG: hypothetical protein H7836_17070 [Magnetococcus sp. YQC-3]
MRLEHFTCTYDPAWDYADIATSMFDGERVLVTLEKLDKNCHVHFQGHTSLAEATFTDHITELAAKHWKKAVDTKCRPIRRARKNIDEQGFQYIMKEEKPTVLFSRGFTDEQLRELHEKALEHKDKFQNGLFETLIKMEVKESMDGRTIYHMMFVAAKKWLKENDRKLSRHTKWDILNAMAFHPQATVAMERYVCDHI